MDERREHTRAHTRGQSRGQFARKLWPIVKREYIERVRTRWFVIATVFAPILFGILLILPSKLAERDTTQSSPYNIALLDVSGAGLGDRVVAAMQRRDDEATPTVRAVRPESLAIAERLATMQIMMRRVSGYVVLDSNTIRGRGARYVGRRNDSQPDILAIGSAIRDGVIDVRLGSRGVTQHTIDESLIPPMPLHTEHAGDQGRAPDNPYKILLATFVAFFLYMSIVLFGQSMLSGVMEEKLTRVSEVVLSSVRADTLLAGKVIGVSAVGLTQQAIWIAGSIGLLALRNSMFGGPSGPDSASSQAMSGVLQAALNVSGGWLALVVLFFVLGFIFFGSLYAAVGATVNSESEARQAAQPVVLLLVMTVVLVQPVLYNPSGRLARALSIFPVSAPILMPLRMAISDVPAVEVMASIVALLAGCAAAVWVAARIYRIGLLMYGKRPTLVELARWVRRG